MTPLARIELTQQPEKIFYKDEGGSKHYYLFVFFVVVGERTPELTKALERACDGRRKIIVDCELLYDNGDPVEDKTMLMLLGNSKPNADVQESQPVYDPEIGDGSVRYRINKVSLRKDNQRFRLRISLRGLENLVEPVITEATQVLSKRKKMRKNDRVPEQEERDHIEECARKRNKEVEAKLAKFAPIATPMVHRIMPAAGFTSVPEFPDLKITPERGSRSNKRARSTNENEDSDSEMDALEAPEPPSRGSSLRNGGGGASHLEELERRIKYLENKVMEQEANMQTLTSMLLTSPNFAYDPNDKDRNSAPPPPPAQISGDGNSNTLNHLPSLNLFKGTLSTSLSQLFSQGGFSTSAFSSQPNQSSQANGGKKQASAKGKGKRARRI